MVISSYTLACDDVSFDLRARRRFSSSHRKVEQVDAAGGGFIFFGKENKKSVVGGRAREMNTRHPELACVYFLVNGFVEAVGTWRQFYKSVLVVIYRKKLKKIKYIY
jgi:hypothetical protein